MYPIPREQVENFRLQRRSLMGLEGKAISLNDCELLWGDKRDPDSNYPKNYLARMIHSLDKKDEEESMNAETFCKIAEKQDLDVVRNICHRSFERFYNDYIGMLQHGKPTGESVKCTGSKDFT